MEEPNDLGTAIRRLRGSRRQWELAEAAGMKPSSWSDYERGKRVPRRKNLERIAAALGCEVRTIEQEALQVSRERLSPDEGEALAAAVETSDALLKDTDRMLRKVDHELDNLLITKRLLLALRQYLLSLPPGTPILADH
jgi:transcriptional regulator with XRE-family HTH domain